MSPKEIKIIDELGKDFKEFFQSAIGFDEYNKAVYEDLFERAMHAAKFDAIASNSICARLASTIDDSEQFNRWITNIRNNNRHDLATQLEFEHFINHGFSSKAQSIINDVLSKREGANLMNIVNGAISAGAFKSALNYINESIARQEVILMTKDINRLKIASDASNKLGLDDITIGSIFDVSGEIIRENRLLWESGSTNITVVNSEQDEPSMLIEWLISVNPTKAAELTWDLTERLVDRDLDYAGFNMGFLGIKLQ